MPRKNTMSVACSETHNNGTHTAPIRIPKNMGIVWETYHKGVPYRPAKSPAIIATENKPSGLRHGVDITAPARIAAGRSPEQLANLMAVRAVSRKRLRRLSAPCPSQGFSETSVPRKFSSWNILLSVAENVVMWCRWKDNATVLLLPTWKRSEQCGSRRNRCTCGKTYFL